MFRLLPVLEGAVTLTREVESLACLGYGLALGGRCREAVALLAELDRSGSRPYLMSESLMIEAVNRILKPPMVGRCIEKLFECFVLPVCIG